MSFFHVTKALSKLTRLAANMAKTLASQEEVLRYQAGQIELLHEIVQMQEHILIRCLATDFPKSDPDKSREEAVMALYYKIREEYLATISVSNFLRDAGSPTGADTDTDSVDCL